VVQRYGYFFTFETMLLQENTSLLPYNTFGMNVTAKHFIGINTLKDLNNFLPHWQKEQLPLLIIGGGSNILFTKNIEGIVLHNNIKGIDIEETKTHFKVKANAGETWHDLVLFCIKKGIGGLENLSLIPGNCGAAPIQNIGAYGVEVKDVLESVTFTWLKSGKTESYSNTQCNFGYRDSIFKHTLKGQVIITSICLSLPKTHQPSIGYGSITEQLKSMGIHHKPSIKNVSDAIIQIRSSKLPNPKEIGNAGSFFKNPVITKTAYEALKKSYPTIPGYFLKDTLVKVPAGWLIEQSGWKGKTINSYGVHKNQALVLVNYGGSEGKDIYQLSTQIIKDIALKFDISLEREVNCI